MPRFPDVPLADDLDAATGTAELARVAQERGVRIVERRSPPTCSDWWDDVDAGLREDGPLLAILIAPRTPAGQATILVSTGAAARPQRLAVAQALRVYADGEPPWLVRGDGLRYLVFQRPTS